MKPWKLPGMNMEEGTTSIHVSSGWGHNPLSPSCMWPSEAVGLRHTQRLQLHELAEGLEASEQPFLWVLTSPSTLHTIANLLPPGNLGFQSLPHFAFNNLRSLCIFFLFLSLFLVLNFIAIKHTMLSERKTMSRATLRGARVETMCWNYTTPRRAWSTKPTLGVLIWPKSPKSLIHDKGGYWLPKPCQSCQCQ